jgi:hypothetical protein
MLAYVSNSCDRHSRLPYHRRDVSRSCSSLAVFISSSLLFRALMFVCLLLRLSTGLIRSDSSLQEASQRKII